MIRVPAYATLLDITKTESNFAKESAQVAFGALGGIWL